MTLRFTMLVLAIGATGLGLTGLSTGVAGARPFCYETGPGMQKCLDNPSGDYFNPIYQGPKLDSTYIPWAPRY